MRVLVVEDSKAMRMILLRTLRQTGLDVSEVCEVVDGVQALSAMETFRPDLVLSDWNMPEKSGIELLRELRAAGDRTPFGFVTSESNPEMRTLAIDAGASFLLCKPFDAERLAEVLGVVVG